MDTRDAYLQTSLNMTSGPLTFVTPAQLQENGLDTTLRRFGHNHEAFSMSCQCVIGAAAPDAVDPRKL